MILVIKFPITTDEIVPLIIAPALIKNDYISIFNELLVYSKITVISHNIW